MISLLLSAALAAGFYHPVDIAATSTQYQRASASGDKLLRVSDQAQTMARALNQLELGLDLLGDRASDDARARHAKLGKQFNREFAVLQAFTDTMAEDFDTVFSEAVDRALPKVAPGAVACERQIPVGRSLPGMRVRLKPNPECKGDDLNSAIVAAIDADPKLSGAIDEILALDWPSITVTANPQPAVGTGEGWVSVVSFVRAGASDALMVIERQDEEARLPFQAAIEQGASAERLESLKAQAALVTAHTRSKRTDLGEPLLAVADAAMLKLVKHDVAAAAWCANPAVLGGCDGEDRTTDLVSRLLANKKVLKQLGR